MTVVVIKPKPRVSAILSLDSSDDVKKDCCKVKLMVAEPRHGNDASLVLG